MRVTTTHSDEIVVKALDGRLTIKFAPPSILSRAKAWGMSNEIRAQYENKTELEVLGENIDSFAFVMSSVVDMQAEKRKDDNRELEVFAEWCNNRKGKTALELFCSLIAMPVAFWDVLIEAFESRPIYTPFEQLPADKIPSPLLAEILNPKQHAVESVGSGNSDK